MDKEEQLYCVVNLEKVSDRIPGEVVWCQKIKSSLRVCTGVNEIVYKYMNKCKDKWRRKQQVRYKV